jgi:hypothetical protein
MEKWIEKRREVREIDLGTGQMEITCGQSFGFPCKMQMATAAINDEVPRVLIYAHCIPFRSSAFSNSLLWGILSNSCLIFRSFWLWASASRISFSVAGSAMSVTGVLCGVRGTDADESTQHKDWFPVNIACGAGNLRTDISQDVGASRARLNFYR